jgi:Flp pilus assembly protein TadG
MIIDSNQGSYLMKFLTKKDRKSERGSVLAMSAIGMLSMLLATGLAVDISHFYSAKAELQNVADAAALAGASQLNSTSGGIKLAVVEATKAMNKYDIKKSVTISPSDVTFAKNLNGPYMSQAAAIGDPAAIRFVSVTVPPQPVGVSFSAMVLGSTKNISAKATAGLSVGLSMNKFHTAYSFIESDAAPIVKGTTLSLDPKAGNDKAPTSYRVLAGPDGDLILTGPVHAYGYIGSSYTAANLPQAEMCRYAKIGMNTRFGDYSVHPNTNAIDHPPDTITQENITYQQYRDMQGNQVKQHPNGMLNRRIFTVPIANNSTYNTSSRTVVSNRLAAFFIKKKVGTDCKLVVEYVGAPVAVPMGTFTPGSPQMTELAIPVLYK